MPDVLAIETQDIVWLGGGFQGAGTGSPTRRNLAAFRASDGALLNWNPDADYTVWALAKSTDGSAVLSAGLCCANTGVANSENASFNQFNRGNN